MSRLLVLSTRKEPTRYIKTYGGSAGIGFNGIASLSASISGTRSAVAPGISGIENKENDTVMDFLTNGIKNHIILYDDYEDTGWLIPQTTIFLYLVQILLLPQLERSKILPTELLSFPVHDGS